MSREDLYDAARCCWTCFDEELEDYLAEREDTEGPIYDDRASD